MRDYRSDIVWCDISSIIPYINNTKKHPKEQIAKIAGSIAEFGFDQPIVIDGDRVIIKGHGRYLAAQQLKLSQIPVLVRTDLTPAQVKASRIADNRVAQSDWDEELLRLEFSDLKSLDIDLGLTGFDDAELSKFLDEPLIVEEDGEVDVDKSELLKEQYGVESGQLWQLGNHRLLIGDATNADDVTHLLDGRIPLLMVTDPPYGVEYDPIWRDNINGLFGDGRRIMRGKVENDDRANWREAWALFPGDVAYIWHSALKIPEIVDSVVKNDFNARSLIVWYKQHFTLMRSGYHWSHESLLYAVRNNKTAHWIGDRKQTTVWQIESLNAAGRKGLKADQEVKLGHGTQKPIECMARPIRNHDSDYVYDPFCGSGTTLIACEQLKRSCLAIEIMPNYGAMIIDRFVKQTEIEPLLL
jgi:DNA modification methylase